MIYVERNGAGTVISVSEVPQTGFEEVSESDPTVTAFFDPPADLAAYAAQCRWQKETGGIVVGGMPIATDDRSKMMITGARLKADADAGFTTQWKAGAAVFVTIDAATIIAISDAVLAHVSACFAIEASVISDIGTGAITTTVEIDAAFAI